VAYPYTVNSCSWITFGPLSFPLRNWWWMMCQTHKTHVYTQVGWFILQYCTSLKRVEWELHIKYAEACQKRLQLCFILIHLKHLLQVEYRIYLVTLIIMKQLKKWMISGLKPMSYLVTHILSITNVIYMQYLRDIHGIHIHCEFSKHYTMLKW
jgi:hypothetical protein